MNIFSEFSMTPGILNNRIFQLSQPLKKTDTAIRRTLRGSTTMKCILVAEDDPNNRDLVTTILSFHGYTTVRATNGRHAVQVAEEKKPDLIMMDLSMPIQNGLDAARQIKKNPTLAHIPIVAMSAYDTREDKVAAFDAGCIAFLPKPLELFKLKDRLEQILANHEQKTAHC